MATAVPAAGRHDLTVISVIGIGHFFAHFYILALPPLFPVLTAGLGFSYTQLGIGLAILNLMTAIAQVPVGMIVDRYGAFWPLLLGQIAFAVGIAAVAFEPSFAVFLVMMAVAGLGNAVYHPADYAILAGSVSSTRLGRAYSVHTFGGYLGFTAAPVLLLPITAAFGWQAALVSAGLLGLLFTLVLIPCRRFLASERMARTSSRSTGTAGTLRLFASWPIAMAFLFFALISAGQGGFSNFGTATLEQLADVDVATAGLPVMLYLGASALGVLIGGQVADRTERHGLVVALCFAVLTLVATILALAPAHLPTIGTLFLVAGLFGGAVSPSRDLMVKQITPSGASGRVFGFVTIGFNAGTLAIAPVFGHLLDRQESRVVFWLIAAISLASIATILKSRGAGAADPRRAAGTA
ncbi:MAG TPA: MFS transporter [Geminicoccus sp.]|uniref:MFS transporter n=1 Tax=Geminicoccus sp. TaxID=2024832 RepID=UPI002E34449B|nr:MFS transporter [Geminicoccus sp.]HEX2529641.1 MFS transporter [Geminicoccus sp.]